MPKIMAAFQIIVGCYLGVAVMIFVLNRLISFSPLDIADFVVDKNSEIILFSPFNSTFFIYSPDLKNAKKFKVPESKGLVKMAIDVNNNIYTANGGFLFKYDLNGVRKQIDSIGSGNLENWKLTSEGKVEYFKNKGESGGKLFTTKRLRRIAKPGDILFYEYSKSDLRSIQDPFFDENGNKYICESWFYGIQVFNPKGELIKNLRPPFYLRAFLLPFPGLYLWIMGVTLLVLIQFVYKLKQKI